MYLRECYSEASKFRTATSYDRITWHRFQGQVRPYQAGTRTGPMIL